MLNAVDPPGVEDAPGRLDRLDTRVDPRPLALARIGIGTAGLLIVLELRETLTRAAEGRMVVPVAGHLPAVSTGLITPWTIAGILASVALVAGFGARAAAGALAALVAAALLWDQQTYSSHVVLLMLLCAYLTLTDAGSAWSLDARRRGEHRPVAYWPQLLMHTQISVVYLFAALSKINGNYLSGEPLRLWMHFTPPLRVAASLALLSILTELFLAAGTWFRITRPAALAAGLGLHVTIVASLSPAVPLLAFALLCVSCYPMIASNGRASWSRP